MIKILPSTVEKEARKGNGSLKHHSKIRKLIEDAESARIHGASTVDSGVVRTHPLYKKALKERDKARDNNKEAKAELQKRKEDLDRKNAQLKANATIMDEMITALWAAIPKEFERENTIRKIENVIDFRSKRH